MLIVAFLAGALWMAREMKSRGRDPRLVVDFVLWMLIGSVIGARLAHVLLDWSAYRPDPLAAFRVWEGGLSFHGGLTGAVAAAALFARVHKTAVLELFDIATPSIPLGYAFARVGCFLSGCCRGIPASANWPLKFRFVEDPQTPWILTVPSHPAQLYASAASLVIFAAILWLKPRFRKPGQLFLSYVVLYSFVRFFMEFIRDPSTTIPIAGWPLTVAQVAGTALAVLATIIILLMERRPTEDEAQPDAVALERASPGPAGRKRRVHR